MGHELLNPYETLSGTQTKPYEGAEGDFGAVLGDQGTGVSAATSDEEVLGGPTPPPASQ